jgi:predicted RNase H-like HicB family nuclease
VLTVRASHSENYEKAVASDKGAAELNLRGMKEEGRTVPREHMFDKIEADA